MIIGIPASAPVSSSARIWWQQYGNLDWNHTRYVLRIRSCQHFSVLRFPLPCSFHVFLFCSILRFAVFYVFLSFYVLRLLLPCSFHVRFAVCSMFYVFPSLYVLLVWFYVLVFPFRSTFLPYSFYIFPFRSVFVFPSFYVLRLPLPMMSLPRFSVPFQSSAFYVFTYIFLFHSMFLFFCSLSFYVLCLLWSVTNVPSTFFHSAFLFF